LGRAHFVFDKFEFTLGEPSLGEFLNLELVAILLFVLGNKIDLDHIVSLLYYLANSLG
jgi:hypothetical protein